jgi:amino-acid N-acetyltransferase
MGVGKTVLSALELEARALGLERLFCLTFETGFFGRMGFDVIGEVGPDTQTPSIVTPEVFAELARSHDEGVAEFLDLARVKPNTLGNTRMLKVL